MAFSFIYFRKQNIFFLTPSPNVIDLSDIFCRPYIALADDISIFFFSYSSRAGDILWLALYIRFHLDARVLCPPRNWPQFFPHFSRLQWRLEGRGTCSRPPGKCPARHGSGPESANRWQHDDCPQTTIRNDRD